MIFETIIGLEIHAQLKTNTKLFSDANTKFGTPPNTSTSYIDAALPGTLPLPNHQAIMQAVKFGLAVNATINDLSYFERKNYFYPDLPKGYQITQNKLPIISNGYLDILEADNNSKRIIIKHAHLEEDAGKLIHNQETNYTEINLNRAGNPLLEIVTTPCINSARDATIFLKKLHNLLMSLDICDGKLQEGSFRCDVNLSVREKGSQELGVRTEIKNLNSFKFIEKAIKYEETRHINLIKNQQTIQQSTMAYCHKKNQTYQLRTKEEQKDYRYFIEPDLLPIKITEEDIKTIKSTMPT